MKYPVLSRYASTLLLACTAAALVQGCKKKSESTVTTSSISIMNDALKTTPQKFTVTAGTEQTIKGSQGTIIHFFPGSFKDNNGNAINSGTISMELTEMYKPGQMIANGAATVTTDGKVMQSGGQVYIKAYAANGVQVSTSGFDLAFKADGQSSTNMQLFYGAKNAAGVLGWTMSDTASEHTAAHGTTDPSDTSGAIPSWLLNNPNFLYCFEHVGNATYYNNDRLVDNGAGFTKMKVVMPDGTFNVDNTKMYLVLPSLNAVVENRIRTYDPSSATFTFGDDGSNVPIGLPYKLVAISLKGTQYYYGEVSGTVTANMSINVTMTADILYDILSRIGAQ